jgi:flagellar hook-length control protein FliK
MNAVALPILSGPTAMPIPSSEGSLPDASLFGSLVAAVAKGGDQQIAGTSETLEVADTAPPHAPSEIPPAFAVRQWFAQTESPPSLSKGLISVLERFGGDAQNRIPSEASASSPTESEDSLPSDDADAAVTPLADPEALETQYAKVPEKTDAASPSDGQPKPHRVEPSEVSGLVLLYPPSVNPQLSIPHQQTFDHGASASIQDRQTSGHGSTVLNTTDGSASASASASVTRPRFPTPPDIESLVAKRLDSAKPSAETNMSEPEATVDHAETTRTTDSPKTAEPNNTPARLTRAPEQGPQLAAHAQTSLPADTSPHPPTPDSISAAPLTTNTATAGESNADVPVKLALPTRTTPQTPELQTLALHIAARSARGDSRFTIRLDPPELGRIDVNLSVNGHGQAQAVLAVEKPQTLDLLQRDAPALERALKDAGLELGGNLSFSLKEEGRSQFARDENDTRPPRMLELVPTEATNKRSALNVSLTDHVNGLRMARLDITV